MIKEFRHDEAAYLAWVQANPEGYVANLDEPLSRPEYPMVHAASKKHIAKEGHTTGQYFKVCSTSMEDLETWATTKFGRQLTRCKRCF
jgi:hypothetical protein